jgi:hypothetical protein
MKTSAAKKNQTECECSLCQGELYRHWWCGCALTATLYGLCAPGYQMWDQHLEQAETIRMGVQMLSRSAFISVTVETDSKQLIDLWNSRSPIIHILTNIHDFSSSFFELVHVSHCCAKEA